jgi:hypothetical protein
MHQGKINNFESAISDVYSQISIREDFPIKSKKVSVVDTGEKYCNCSFSFLYEQDENNMLQVRLDEEHILSLFRITPIKAGGIYGKITFSTSIIIGERGRRFLEEQGYSYEAYRKYSEELFSSYINLRSGSNGHMIEAMCHRLISFQKNNIKIGDMFPSFEIKVKDEIGHNLYYQLNAELTFSYGAKRKLIEKFNLADDEQFKLMDAYSNPTSLDIKNILKNSGIK